MVRELIPRQILPPTKYVRGVGIATEEKAYFHQIPIHDEYLITIKIQIKKNRKPEGYILLAFMHTSLN
ncbi:hypothetical protein OKW24_001452 [Peribacillus simplex]|nr:hypothetical protein [Peribacillus simplex]